MPAEPDAHPVLEHYEDEYSSTLRRVESLSRILDSRFRIPVTNVRFGWDSIVGLIPGVGDTLMVLPQLYLVYEARRLGLGKRTLARMLGNILVDWIVGSVPVLGDVFDVAFKSNRRNASIVTHAIRKRRIRDEPEN